MTTAKPATGETVSSFRRPLGRAGVVGTLLTLPRDIALGDRILGSKVSGTKSRPGVDFEFGIDESRGCLGVDFKWKFDGASNRPGVDFGSGVVKSGMIGLGCGR